MNQRFQALLTSAREKDVRLSFVLAGGGADLFGVFKIPGCSQSMMEARMLYSQESVRNFLADPALQQFVCQPVADQLARRMDELSEADICFAATSALSTLRERRGQNRGFMAISCRQNIVLQKELIIRGSSREAQDASVADDILTSVLNLLGKQ